MLLNTQHRPRGPHLFSEHPPLHRGGGRSAHLISRRTDPIRKVSLLLDPDYLSLKSILQKSTDCLKLPKPVVQPLRTPELLLASASY